MKVVMYREEIIREITQNFNEYDWVIVLIKI